MSVGRVTLFGLLLLFAVPTVFAKQTLIPASQSNTKHVNQQTPQNHSDYLLHLRPNAHSKVISKIKNPQLIVVIEEAGKWSRVMDPVTGEVGWSNL